MVLTYAIDSLFFVELTPSAFRARLHHLRDQRRDVLHRSFAEQDAQHQHVAHPATLLELPEAMRRPADLLAMLGKGGGFIYRVDRPLLAQTV